MMGFGFLGMLLVLGVPLALLVGGAAQLFRRTPGIRLDGGRNQPTALQVLDERLARGEISREEYETIRARIE